MTGQEYLANELKKYNCICYYPSSGTDLNNLDYFGSGKKPWSERVGEIETVEESGAAISNLDTDPDLFIHSDINFYQEFESGLDMLPNECGIHGSYEILEFRELPALKDPNFIFSNYAHSGRCFEYKLKVWGCDDVKTLIYCLCENEYLVSKIFLANNIRVPLIWSRNWAGGHTYGTWLANVLDELKTEKVYTDWLCIPGKRGEPRNRLVEEKYPELMVPSKIKLVRNNDVHWIDEGTSGWVEEFDVEMQK